MRPLPLARPSALHLTSLRWAHSISLAHLNSVTPEDLSFFRSVLSSPTSVLTAESDDLTAYNKDWMGKYEGKATTVLRPRSTQEVAEIVRWCSEKKIGIVPQGGNTGLVGGSVPVGGEVVLNLGNMAKVRSFDPVSGEREIRIVTSRELPIERSCMQASW